MQNIHIVQITLYFVQLIPRQFAFYFYLSLLLCWPCSSHEQSSGSILGVYNRIPVLFGGCAGFVIRGTGYGQLKSRWVIVIKFSNAVVIVYTGNLIASWSIRSKNLHGSLLKEYSFKYTIFLCCMKIQLTGQEWKKRKNRETTIFHSSRLTLFLTKHL